eukprot:g24840.t1
MSGGGILLEVVETASDALLDVDAGGMVGIKAHMIQQLRDTHSSLEPSSPPLPSDSIPFPNPTFCRPADKGGDVVAWHTDLYIAEADHQLSDTSSYLPLDHDPTMACSNRLLFTMDVQSLYTSIPQQEGLRALRFFLEQSPEPSPSTTTLHCLDELVLAINNFSFNSSHFLQVRGVAMGTCMGPSYAFLFM